MSITGRIYLEQGKPVVEAQWAVPGTAQEPGRRYVVNAPEPLTAPEPDLHPDPPEPEFPPVAPALSRLFVWDPEDPPARCEKCDYLPTSRGHLIICGEPS